MPTRPKSHSERQRAVTRRKAWDEWEQTEGRHDPAWRQAVQIRSSARWQKVRALQLAKQPLCQDPYQRHGLQTVPATEVDHRQPLRTHPALAFALDNLASLCAACHAIKSRTERRH